jgi:peptide chain release factor 3
MVIDAANGVEPQTRRLLQVCRARKTPILTFVNKMDREVQEPLALMDEIERELGMGVVPFTWPVGMGKRFHGVMDLREERMRVFSAGADRSTAGDDETIEGLDNPELAERFGAEYEEASVNVQLLRDAAPAFDGEAFLAGEQTPMFFGSAINNFGVREVLDALVDLAPPPSARAAIQRIVQPDETKLTGVVFKIQANMDPAHRDRIAFVRVASGHFERGMRIKVARSGKELRPNTVVSFLSQRASCSTRPMRATSSASRTMACFSSATRSPKARRCSTPGCPSSRRRCSARSRSPTRCAPSSCAPA